MMPTHLIKTGTIKSTDIDTDYLLTNLVIG